MSLISLPGYRNVVALDKDKHRGKGVDPSWPYIADLNAIYITIAEFVTASRQYPIAFVKGEEPEPYLPVMVTGLAKGGNLFATREGAWATDWYAPAFVRQYPFCIIDVKRGEGAEREQLICVDEEALVDDSDSPLFDADGKPTQYWGEREKFLREVNTARQQTRIFVNALAQADLFEPFEAKFLPRDAEGQTMTGLYRVNEEKLNKLPTAQLREQMRRGELSRIYAHLMSLDNFRNILDRLAVRDVSEA